MDKEESNLLGVIARYGQVNESSDSCDLGEGGATQGLVMLREIHIFLVVTRFKQTCMATATRDYQRWIKQFLLTLNISFNICIILLLLLGYVNLLGL